MPRPCGPLRTAVESLVHKPCGSDRCKGNTTFLVHPAKARAVVARTIPRREKCRLGSAGGATTGGPRRGRGAGGPHVGVGGSAPPRAGRRRRGPAGRARL